MGYLKGQILKIDLTKRITQWIVLIVISFIWGSSFILVKKSLIAYPPMLSGAIRLNFAFLYFLPITVAKFRKINRKNLIWILLAGFIGSFFPAFMFAYGQTEVSSAMASMINSTTPIFVLITGVLMFSEKLTLVNLLGLIIGFVGTIGLAIDNPSSMFLDWKFGAVLMLIASLFYGINTNIIKYKLKDLDGLAISALTYTVIAPFSLIYPFFSDFKTTYHNDYFWQSTISLAVLAFFSSFLAIILFVWLLKFSSAIFVASSTYIMPIFAIGWGLWDGEVISTIQIISVLIIFLGVALVNKNSAKKT